MAPIWIQAAYAAALFFSSTTTLVNSFVTPSASRVASMQSSLSMSMADTVASHVDAIATENIRYVLLLLLVVCFH